MSQEKELSHKLEKIEHAITAQESLRGTLPAQQLKSSLDALRQQKQILLAQLEGSGAVAQGGSTAIGQQGVGVKGDLNKSTINTGTINYFYQIFQKTPRDTPLSREEFERVLNRYLIWVRKAYNKARLYGLENVPTTGGTPVKQLSDVFVPLKLRRFSPPKRAEIEQFARKFQGDPMAEHKAYLKLAREQKIEGESISLGQLLTVHDRQAIIGGAGSGKSTLVAYLAASLTETILGSEDLPFELPPQHEQLIPVVIPLRYYREYKALCHKSPRDLLHTPEMDTLAGYIPWYFRKRNPALKIPAAFFDRLLRGGGCLLMLDGLDEVVSRDERGQVREEVERLAGEFYPENILVVTAREAGYRENAVFGDNFVRLDVQPLDDEDIETLTEKWCRQLYPEDVKRQTQEIVEAITEINTRYREKGLPALISTPLMTTMVVSVKWGEAELPRERATLYEAAVKVILQSQYISDDPTRKTLVNWGGPWKAQREWLSHLALAMHQGGLAGAFIPEVKVREIMGEYLTEEELNTYVRVVRSRGGLLEEQAELFQFLHLTFQEFLAARLLAKQREDSYQELQGHVQDSWWREIFLLTYGFAKTDWAPFAAKYLDWLSNLEGKDCLAGRELAAAAVLEIERPDPELRHGQAMLLAEAIETPGLENSPAERAAAGDTLARLGDPRFDPEHWHLPDDPMLGFVHIPAGTFLMGSDPKKDSDAMDREQPQHEVTLPDYYMARYPVTVAQFRTFIKTRGYNDFNDSALQDPPNRPVRYVTWYNALAYTQWLQEELSAVSAQCLAKASLSDDEKAFWQGLAEGKFHITLPSEAEWEKAARGGSPLPEGVPQRVCFAKGLGVRVYPWGNEPDPNRANYDDTGIGTTSTVGCFPHGASPYGVLDLSGNVWEWTRSLWGESWSEPDFKYPYDPTDGRENFKAGDNILRVLRGGSFDLAYGLVRCASRDLDYPGGGGFNGGFRVVVSPLPRRGYF
ncbi:MAG: SUMF1/EgtB/PvdO family nonheme iron enzyme [Chloroflexota bacterium]|nr:SUMF1/EgtB/PvdO family nonheme iron enzyme [Chloroflexota bacterium]